MNQHSSRSLISIVDIYRDDMCFRWVVVGDGKSPMHRVGRSIGLEREIYPMPKRG
jgi:hypothetical protein